MDDIKTIAEKMSPYENTATLAYLAGDDSTETMHKARREIAAYTDKLTGRNRRIPQSGARAELIRAGRAAYDHMADELNARGAL